jgi:hypothetical protein
MTLPEQSDRAVVQTREFLVRLASPFVEGGIKGIRREVRAEALALLRHYPYVWLSQKCDCPAPDNAARQDILTGDTPAAHTTPGKGTSQGVCTLTDEERDAIAWCVAMAETTATDCDEELAALRGLLERTK